MSNIELLIDRKTKSILSLLSVYSRDKSTKLTSSSSQYGEAHGLYGLIILAYCRNKLAMIIV